MLTPYQKRQKDEDFTDWDFLSWEHDQKSTVERRKLIFQNKCVSSQNKRMKKEEGATVAATPLPFLSGQLRYVTGRTGKQRLLQTIGRDSLNTTNVLPSTRNAGVFRLQLIGSPIQMNKWNKKMQLSLRTD